MHTGSLTDNRIYLGVSAAFRNAAEADAKAFGLPVAEFIRNIHMDWLLNIRPRWRDAIHRSETGTDQ
jgi:hypothetical protein